MTRILLAAMAALLGAAPQQVDPDHAAKMARGLEAFKKGVRAVLEQRCARCHSGETVKSKLDLSDRPGLLRGGENGPAIVPGSAKASLLYKLITHSKEPHMPHKGPRLSDEEVARVAEWIDLGAPYDKPLVAEGAPKVHWTQRTLPDDARAFWSFQPLRPVAPPRVTDEKSVRTPIDRFILAKLDAAGIAPNPPADRRRLARRAALDLTGLPPTPEEVEAFVDDPAPDAWERYVDRLLASPGYGERWGRHWLDVARFAESHGFEQDYNRDHAYHYRDFVIRALNDDMPFDRFVHWQVAGDELAPGEPLAWMATGFLGAGAFPTQLTENEFEPARYDELDNMASTVGTAFLGLTVGCARCHDHKYDPIPARDFYRLASTFTAAIRSDVELDLDSAAARPALEAWEKRHAPVAAALVQYEQRELPGRLDRWLAERAWEKQPVPAWAVLDILASSSVGKAAFQKLPDGSLLVTGEKPKNDSWVFTAATSLEGITAVRVEALSDPSLVKGGPGRADNGNFALSDLEVAVSPRTGGAPRALKLVSATATFEQNATNLSVKSVIDGKKETGWAVDPQFGKDHAAVFTLAEPAAGGSLRLALGFQVGERHAIGRPRISVTTRPAPHDPRGEAVPQAAFEFLEDLRAGREVPRERALAAFRLIDPEARRLARAVAESLTKKPQPKLTKVLVTTEGMKPQKHHADDRGFKHFYPETHFLARGDVNRKEGMASQGFLQVVTRAPESTWIAAPPPGSRTPHRRAALARWLTDVEQGAGHLLARVIVNRLWHHHFGRGIVASPSDFGRQGEAPSHPDLLDWLAGELIRGGPSTPLGASWSLKRMHRLLMTSAVYQRSGVADPEKARRDPDVRLFWRWDVRRLEAETIRDAILAVGGLLDRKMFGPGTLDENSLRRSVYFMVKRSQLISSMMVLDAPESLVSIGQRPTTTVAPQALLFMNSPLVRRAAVAFAKRVEGPDAVRRAYAVALGRAPSPQEELSAAAFLARQSESYSRDGKPLALALVDLCQILFSTSEFVYVE